MTRELLDSNVKVNLFTRFRRFGKTLNISMLQRFFEKTDEDNAYLFNGLNIFQAGEKYMQHQRQYPMISLSLKSMKQGNYAEAFSCFKDVLQKEFWRHRNVFESDTVLPKYKELFSSICSDKAPDSEYKTAIRTLSDCLYAVYQKNVIILIDEYDVPLEASHFREFYDEMVDLIRSVFESALKMNPYLEFGVLTGCLRVVFAEVTEDDRWLRVYESTNAIIADLLERYPTGLLPDFLVLDETGIYSPAPENFLEDVIDGEYAYNSCRTPWRIGMDALITGNETAEKLAKAVSEFMKQASGGDPWEIAAGYTLTGEQTADYSDLCFLAPVLIAAKCSDDEQWEAEVRECVMEYDEAAYYGDSIRMLCLIVDADLWIVV